MIHPERRIIKILALEPGFLLFVHIFFFILHFTECSVIFAVFLHPLFRVSVIGEIVVPAVRKLRMACRLERAPVPFGACAYLHSIGKKPIDIAAVETIDLLEPVEVIQKPSFVDKMIAPSDPRDAIERESRILVYGQEDIEHESRDNHHIDKWSSDDVPYRSIEEHAEKPFLEAFVSLGEFLEEYYFSFLDSIPVLGRESGIFLFQICAKRFKSFDEFVDF